MVADTLINLQTYRKRKSRSRIMQALEAFYTEVLTPQDEGQAMLADAEEYEDFTTEILADHIIGKLHSSKDFRGMDHHYREFDQKLRHALQRKMKSLARFESMRRF